MIGSLRGHVLEINATSILLEAAGVGYRVFASPALLGLMKTGEAVFLYIHDHIREESRDLYGFLTAADLSLYEQLLGVSGVGPKVAMTLLATGSADQVRAAIMAGDIAFLTSVPGVGKKTAQKIILDLKGQLVEASALAPADEEVVQALQALGYSGQQAREVLKTVSVDYQTVSDKLREALRFLSRA